MWKLKVLKGAQPQEYQLKEGLNIIGRLATCDVVITSQGISKKHAQILVREGVCSITDLGSTNGTYVNGSKVQDRILKSNDRIAFHTVVVELTQEGSSATQQPLQFQQPVAQQNPMQSVQFEALQSKSLSYIDQAILPGVYKLNELYPLKNILLGFILSFALIVTILATIPMSAMMKEGVEKEAQRRALTISRQLAALSEKAFSQGAETSIRTDFAETEDGVTAAMVVAKDDGHIIAPLAKAQSYSNEEFVARARKHDDIFVTQINSIIGASYPVRVFSPETGQQTIAAYSIVLYKINSVDLGSSVGLFARILIIALLFGYLVYFFIFKIFSKNIEYLTEQVDLALRGETSIIQSKYNFAASQDLLTNINSALSRMGQPQNQMAQISYDPSLEAMNLVRIVHDAAIVLSSEKQIISVNTAFEDLTGMRLLTIQNQNLEVLQDQALKLNLEDLWQKSLAQPTQISSSVLEISGIEYEIDAQAVSNSEKVGYTLITLKKRMAA